MYAGLILALLLIPGCQSREESGDGGEMPVHVGAALTAADVTLTNAIDVYQRDRQVVKTGGVSEQKLQSCGTSAQHAEAQMRQAHVNLPYTTIREPFTGALDMRQISLGAYWKPDDPIVSIRQMDPLYLGFEIPQQTSQPSGFIQQELIKIGVPGLHLNRRS
jgi:multidrug efflux pump subunit AcrA (membrane-fusion protein)